jgi:hypothetical protein
LNKNGILLALLFLSACATPIVQAPPTLLACADGSAPISTKASWSYVVSLPKFLDHPFACRCEAVTADQCRRTLKITADKFLEHVSNATISPACVLGVSTIALPE